jgi:Pyridoxal phosphate biosynthesis protein
MDCQLFGADGITVHPRPDQRHIRYTDVFDLQAKVNTEFNIEGNPTPEFISLIKKIRPTQVTLVPDTHDAITSNAGWDTIIHKDFLTDIVGEFQSIGVRTSIFVDPNLERIRMASQIGTDRVELYTGSYAEEFSVNKEKAVAPFVEAAVLAKKSRLGSKCGTRSESDESSLSVHQHPLVKRGFHRAFAHQRRTLSGVKRNNKSV